jgi:hypothetical protein
MRKELMEGGDRVFYVFWLTADWPGKKVIAKLNNYFSFYNPTNSIAVHTNIPPKLLSVRISIPHHCLLWPPFFGWLLSVLSSIGSHLMPVNFISLFFVSSKEAPGGGAGLFTIAMPL